MAGQTSGRWTTSPVRSRPSPAGASPPRRIRRWCPTRRASRPPGTSSPSGWARNYPFHHPRYAGQMLKPPHPGRDRGVHGGDARQRQQPRARRRAGDERDGGRGDARLADDVRLPGGRARPPDLLGDDREPRGAVGGARAAPGQGHRPRRQRALHPLADVRGARGRRRSRCPRTSWAGSTWTWSKRCAGRARSARSCVTAGLDRAPGRSTMSRGRSRCASATACGCTSTRRTAGSSRCLPSGRRRWSPPRRSWRSPRPTASSSTRTSTGCSRTGAARCCSATRASGGSTSTTRPTRTSPRAICTWARSAWSARGRAPPRRRCG